MKQLVSLRVTRMQSLLDYTPHVHSFLTSYNSPVQKQRNTQAHTHKTKLKHNKTRGPYLLKVFNAYKLNEWGLE